MSKPEFRLHTTTDWNGVLLRKVQKKLWWFPIWLTVGKYYTRDYALWVKEELEKAE